MRTMLMFRGAPGSGKSTMIDNLGLRQYALSADEIRLLIQSPALTPDGSYTIAMNSEKKVWEILMDALEARMERGEFVVIDATNSKTSEMTKYKDLAATYRYRMYIIDLTDLPIEICKERNANRLPEYKRVPEHAIENQYARFATQGIPGSIKRIKLDSDKSVLDQMSFGTIDFSNYRKIHHIGDIHGCCTVLKEYMDKNFNEEDLFIFTGDYLDRGIEAKETLEYLFYLHQNHKNVIFIEGNHEVHLRRWANDIHAKSKEFMENTVPQIEGEVSKKDARAFCRDLRQFAYYTYGDKVVVCTHGGVPRITEPTVLMPTIDFIKGVGAYEDALTVALAFETNMPDNYYQIHGHRNIDDLPVRCTDRCFNLEGQVELGGHLRIVTLDENGFETFEIENNVFSKGDAMEANMLEKITEEDMFDLMSNNHLVKAVKQGNLTSFNFKPAVFKGRLWDAQTIKARGLFFNHETKKIVLRSYNKFFNINERENTKLHNLKYNFTFPVREYLKYNGFLGLLGVNEGELVFSSKSSVNSEHARWFKKIFMDTTTQEQREQIKKYLEDNNATMPFEVIDPVNDPHIIKYDKPFIVLLDVVYNEVDFRKLPYEELLEVGKDLGLQVKELCGVYNTWSEFYHRYLETNEEDFKYNGEWIEGFVYEDEAGFATKSKLFYYKQWKLLRGVAQKQIRYNHIKFTSALTTPEANLFYGWLKEQDRDDVINKDIVTLRDMYENR